MKIFAWLYPDFDQLGFTEYRQQLFQRLRRLKADGVYFMTSAELLARHEEAVARCLGEARAAGFEFHLGLCPFAAPETPTEEQLERRYQYRTKKEVRGRNLCPSWPENRDWACESVDRACQQFHPQGLHLDFIRYFFANSEAFGEPLEWEAGRKWIDTYHRCECATCEHVRQTIIAREEFTDYDEHHPAVIFKELEHRKRNIDQVIGRIRQTTRDLGIKLSVACRVQYLNRALIEGQDWVDWCRRKWVDVLSPMNYSSSLETVKARLAENMRRLKGMEVEVWEGLGKRSSAGYNSTAMLVRQAEAALEAGAAGIALFHLDTLEEEDFPALARLKERA